MTRRVHVSNSTPQEDGARFEAEVRRLGNAISDLGLMAVYRNLDDDSDDSDSDDSEQHHDHEAAREVVGPWIPGRRRRSSKKRRIFSEGISGFAASLAAPLQLLVSSATRWLVPRHMPQSSVRETH